MEVSTLERVGELPAPLADGRCFRKASTSEDGYPDDPVAAGRDRIHFVSSRWTDRRSFC